MDEQANEPLMDKIPKTDRAYVYAVVDLFVGMLGERDAEIERLEQKIKRMDRQILNKALKP